MPVQDSTNFFPLLKEWYSEQRVMQLILTGCPLLGMLRKTQIGGKTYPLPIVYGDSPGHSSTFATAQLNKGGSTSASFQLTTSISYSLAALTNKVLKESANDKGAFMSAATQNINGALRQLKRDTAIGIYRDGSGQRGQVQTFTAGSPATILLTDPWESVNFGQGDVLAFGPLAGPLASGTFTITAINMVTGLLSGTATGTITNGDYIFPAGDFNLKFKGLDAILPTTNPGGSDNFFGVNRSVNRIVFAGSNVNLQGLTRYEGLLSLMSQINVYGDGLPATIFMHPEDLRLLVLELETTVERQRPDRVEKKVTVTPGSTTTVGYSGVLINGAEAGAEIYGDRFCKKGKVYALSLPNFALYHLGSELVEMFDRDSDKGMLLEPTSDGYEIRCASYLQPMTDAPAYSGVGYNFGS